MPTGHCAKYTRTELIQVGLQCPLRLLSLQLQRCRGLGITGEKTARGTRGERRKQKHITVLTTFHTKKSCKKASECILKTNLIVIDTKCNQTDPPSWKEDDCSFLNGTIPRSDGPIVCPKTDLPIPLPTLTPSPSDIRLLTFTCLSLTRK